MRLALAADLRKIGMGDEYEGQVYGVAMFKVGLTGGIGSGKSRVAEWLDAWGATVIDTDVIAHRLTGPQGAAMPAIVEAFGDWAAQSDGAMDRAKVRAFVFEHPSEKKRLERILHPLISHTALSDAAGARGEYVVYVVPLLTESGAWRERVDRIAVVDCEPETQVERVRQRSGLTDDIIRRIMAAQADRFERLAIADDVIANGKDISVAQLEERVQQCHRQWRAGRSCVT